MRKKKPWKNNSTDKDKPKPNLQFKNPQKGNSNEAHERGEYKRLIRLVVVYPFGVFLNIIDEISLFLVTCLDSQIAKRIVTQ